MIWDMINSKKFVTSFLASVLALIGLLNGLTPAEVAIIIGPLVGYTVAQGAADAGKEKAKIEQDK